jgi:hypothetical protein
MIVQAIRDNMIEKWMDAHDVAQVLRCSVSFVHKERAAGRIRASRKIGCGEKGWRFLPEDVAAYQASKSVTKMDGGERDPLFVPVERYGGTRRKTKLHLIK